MSLTNKLGISGAVLAAFLNFGKVENAYAQNPSGSPGVKQNRCTIVSGMFANDSVPYHHYLKIDSTNVNAIRNYCLREQAQQDTTHKPTTQRSQTHRTTRTPVHRPVHARKTLRHVPHAAARATVQTRQIPYINTDSIARESRRIAEYRARQDSTAKARADSIYRADSIKNAHSVYLTHPVQSTGLEFRPQREGRNSVEFGLGASYGTNRELSLEAFVNNQLFRGLRLEAYADWSAVKENAYDTFNHSDTTNVLRESLSPGIYKTTNTVVNTSRFQKGIAEVGGRVVISPAKWFDILLGAGARIVMGTQDKDGQETIGYETNGLPRDSTYTISNSKENNVTNVLLSLGAGARFNFNGVNLSLNYNRVGKRNIWRPGLGFTF